MNFSLTIIISFLVIAALSFLYIYLNARRVNKISGSLGLQLFLVSVPELIKENENPNEAQKNFIAKIDKVNDYNIFHPEGTSRGATLGLAKNGFLPIKTYQKLESDPLETITSAFSKINEYGEGAALQLVLRPAGKKLEGPIHKVIEKLKEGKPRKEVLGEKNIAEEAISIFKAPGKKPEEKISAPVYDEGLVKRLAEKVAKPIFDVNARLIVSASTSDEADRIMKEFEAGFYQFTDPEGNGIKPINVFGKSFKQLVENFSFRLFDQTRAVAVIDPHGELIEKVLELVPRERAEDVIYFDPGDTAYSMGLNMLEYDPRFPEQKSLIVNELLEIFNKLFNMSIAGGPAFEQYFRNAAMLVMGDPESGNTLLEIVRVFADKTFRDYKLSKSKNIVINQFWQQIAEKATGDQSLQNYGPYVTNKFDTFLSSEILRPIISQEKSAFNIREVMDNKKILLLNLSKGRLGELNSSLLGLIMVGKILMAALSRVNMPEAERQDFYLYIDEFQNVTTKSIATILSEARKYKLDLILTHQFIGQLEEDIQKAVFGNVGSICSFRIGSDDGEYMEKQFAPTFTAPDLLNIDNRNAYLKLLVDGQTSKPFNIKTIAPEKGNPEMAEYIKQLSRSKFARPRDEVEEEIRKRHTEK